MTDKPESTAQSKTVATSEPPCPCSTYGHPPHELGKCPTADASAPPDELAAAVSYLRLILPMAKGYAAANRVGMNAAYIESVENWLWHYDHDTRADLSDLDRGMAVLTDVLADLSEAGVDLEEREIGVQLGLDRAIEIVEGKRDEWRTKGTKMFNMQRWTLHEHFKSQENAAYEILTALKQAKNGEKGNA